MTSKQKFTVVAVIAVLVAATAIGASSVLAQNDGNTTPTPSPSGTSEYGWNMHGMMWGNWQDDSMWTAVANTLGIDVNTLFNELQSGTTLAQIAEAYGVDVQMVYDAALTVMTDHMNAMVTAGYITQGQADAYQAWMRDNMAQMPVFSGAGFGPCMMNGMIGNSYPNMMLGMMGNGGHGGMMSGHQWNGMHDNWDNGQHHGGWGQ
jgi:hypothetical protein